MNFNFTPQVPLAPTQSQHSKSLHWQARAKVALFAVFWTASEALKILAIFGMLIVLWVVSGGAI